MTTINPTSLPSTTLIRRAGFTPPSTDHLRALVARRLSQPGLDGATLSGSTRGIPGLTSVDGARQGLGEVANLLDQLKDQVNKLGTGEGSKEGAQAAIDELITSIDDAARRTGLGDVGGDGFSILDVAGQVTNLNVYNVKLAPGEEEKVEIDVRASAQQAGLFMDFANGQLDLGDATRSFTIEVEGRNGSKQLTFSSGASAESIAKAINSFSKETGVDARLSGTGIRLESRATGSAELTSIRVIDDGGASDDAGKIYRLNAGDADEADMTSKMTFDSVIAHSGSGIRDKGQDAEVWVNGTKAAVYGSEVLASNDKFTAMFYLDRLQTDGTGPNAQRLGVFTGFTIKANGQVGPDGSGDSGHKVTPGEPGEPNDPKKVSGVDDVNLAPPIPPPQEDYGREPEATPGEPGENGYNDAKRATDMDVVTPSPKVSPSMDRSGPEVDEPAKNPGGGGKGEGGGSPVDDLKAAAGGPRIDPTTVRAAIDRLRARIDERSGALDLIERVGLKVVPASLVGAVGLEAEPDLGFGSALTIAKAIRTGVLDDTGRMGDLAGGTTSAQVLRLLSGDGIR